MEKERATGKATRAGNGPPLTPRRKRKAAPGKPTTAKATDVDPVSGDKLLFDSAEEVPAEVAALAGVYEKSVTVCNKAKSKEKGAKAAICDAMIKAGIERIPIRGGREWLVVENESKVAIRKPEKGEEIE